MRLNKEHGLNPTIPVCFFCGKDKNQIAFLGAALKASAPMTMIIDKEPCDECKKGMTLGITFIQMGLHSEGPTGRFCVIKEDSEFIQNIQEDLRKEILKKRKAYVRVEDWEKLGLP